MTRGPGARGNGGGRRWSRILPRTRGDVKRQRDLDPRGQEESAWQVHGQERHRHGHREGDGGEARQEPQHQGESAPELGPSTAERVGKGSPIWAVLELRDRQLPSKRFTDDLAPGAATPFCCLCESPLEVCIKPYGKG